MSASGSGDVGLLAPDYTLNPAGPASSAEIDFKCPNCNKIYRGKHARSIWRRHLQDKHGIPLSMQPRRTRWDNGPLLFLSLTPKSETDAERMCRCQQAEGRRRAQSTHARLEAEVGPQSEGRRKGQAQGLRQRG